MTQTLYELNVTFWKPDIVRPIKIARIRWISHVVRVDETEPLIQVIRPVKGRSSVGRWNIRFLDQVEANIKQLDIQNWRTRATNREDGDNSYNWPRPIPHWGASGDDHGDWLTENLNLSEREGPLYQLKFFTYN